MKRNLLLSFPKAARLLLAALICLPFWGTTLMAQTAKPEAYAVFDSSTGTLTFKYDNSKPSGAYMMNTGNDFPGWMANKEEIKKVVFDPSFAGARPTTCYCWFEGCQDLTDIEGISNLNTEQVTNMHSMFAGCEKLTSLDLSSFNTENVTNMYFMFTGCHALTTIYASDKFVVTNVESDAFMFAECEKLKGAIEYDENKTNSRYANYTTGYFTLKLPTSINAINGNDKAEYFDINGKRSTKLQCGINLVRRGNKTYKVVVK